MRRLSLAAALVASVALAAPAIAQKKDTDRLDGRERAAHLLSRIAFGADAASMAEVGQAGIEAWIDGQLASSGPDAELAARLRAFDFLDLPSRDIYKRFASGPAAARPPLDQPFLGSILVRAVENRNQAAEVMAEFWRNHFNVDRSKDSVRYTSRSHSTEV